MNPSTATRPSTVEAQLRTPTSLLRWMRRFHRPAAQGASVFGLGTFEALTPANPKIFACIRTYQDDVVLCVHKPPRSAQAVELDFLVQTAAAPVEMFGRSRFRRSAELPTC